jgi:arginyl-tRNA synthetase
LLARFPEEIADAAASFEPHRIASFLMRLAQSYHRFYTEHRVLADDPVEANSIWRCATACES